MGKKNTSTTWTSVKPEFKEDCILIAATYYKAEYDSHWAYSLFTIQKIEMDENWYWGIFVEGGDEWGDLADLEADLYMTMPMLPSPIKK